MIKILGYMEITNLDHTGSLLGKQKHFSSVANLVDMQGWRSSATISAAEIVEVTLLQELG